MGASHAEELARSWRELGSLLASRRLLASLGGEESKLTPTKLRALDVLAERRGLRIGDLGGALSVDETTATRLADRLVASGLAVRERDPEDGRAVVLVLTAAGKRLATQVARRRREFFRDVLAALEPDERAELVRLTVKVADALRERSAELAAR